MIKLYEKQSYLKECQTKITEVWKKDNKVYIKLNESIFFPNEGGQYADTGVIEFVREDGNKDAARILDGNVAGQDIVYETDKEIAIGTEVLCKLDWDMRFDRMQNHSGEHILSGLIHNKYGLNNIGFHLSDEAPVTLNMDGMLTSEQLTELEREVNSIIYENVPITDLYPTKSELETIEYRSKIEIEGQVRLIRIGEENNVVDMCACCAPHVKRTGEIGLLKIVGVSKAKGGVLISILCGRRALNYVNHNLNIINRIANSFSTHPDNVEELVNKLRLECNDLKAGLSKLREQSIIQDIKTGNSLNCIFVSGEFSAQNMKNIYNELVLNKEGYVSVFAGDDETGYRYFAGGNGLDATILAVKMREALNAKGGGSPEMIQGKTDSLKEDIMKVWDTIF